MWLRYHHQSVLTYRYISISDKMASSTGSGSSSEDADTDGLRSMLMTFRISELSQLLDFAGKNKTGKKSELQVQHIYST